MEFCVGICTRGLGELLCPTPEFCANLVCVLLFTGGSREEQGPSQEFCANPESIVGTCLVDGFSGVAESFTVSVVFNAC